MFISRKKYESMISEINDLRNRNENLQGVLKDNSNLCRKLFKENSNLIRHRDANGRFVKEHRNVDN